MGGMGGMGEMEGMGGMGGFENKFGGFSADYGKQTNWSAPQTIASWKNDNYCNFSIQNTLLREKMLKRERYRKVVGRLEIVNNKSESIHLW